MSLLARAGFAVRRLALSAAFLGLLSLAGSPAFAGKPSGGGGGSTGPTGTIYYRNGTVINAVKPDGSGAAADVLPGYADLSWPAYGDPNPAFRPSGSNATQDRWWIYSQITGLYANYDYGNGTVLHDLPHYDLFAVRSNPQNRSQLVTVQLTDLYGIARFMSPIACWSNDDNTDVVSSFVASDVRDIRDAFDGTTVYVAQSSLHTLRLPITTDAIQAGWESNNFVPFGQDPADEAELDAMLLPWFNPDAQIGNPSKQGYLAPSGGFYVGITSVAQGRTELFIAEWSNYPTGNPPFVLWDGRDGVPKMPWTAQWSPDGQSIAIEDRGQGQLGGGSIYTQPASGTSSPKLVLNISVKGQTVTTYSNPIWSPDNKYLAVTKRQYNGSTLTGAWLTRLSLSDGKTLDLVPIADGTQLLRWTADN